MVQEAQLRDVPALAALAALLWTGHSVKELTAEFSGLFSQGSVRFFLKYVAGTSVGFAQCQLRHDYVEGTQTSPVGYLEGIFVQEEFRGKGYGKELLSACEAWAREMGCTEFASDCELDNVNSLSFHTASGFAETNRIICFLKKL